MRNAGSTRSRIAASATGLACAAVLVCGGARAAEPTKSQCIDANEAAQPLRQSGKLHAAEERLLVCVHPACPGPVRDDCAQRLTELRAATPTVVFAAKDEAEEDLSAVRVTMDGQPLLAALDGTAIAVDPGEHRFVFEADGRVREEKTLVLREGDKGRRERIVLLAATPAPQASPPPPEPSATPEAHPEQPPAPGARQRAAGIALAGVGLAGAIVSSIFGIVAKSLYVHAANDECGNRVGLAPNVCTPDGYNDGQTAHGQALGSTIGFIASAAFVAGGATLYFTAPRVGSVAVAPTVAAGGMGLGLSGRW